MQPNNEQPNINPNPEPLSPQPVTPQPAEVGTPVFSQPPPQPQPAPMAVPPQQSTPQSYSQQAAAPPPVNSPGIIVLQWLTYAFWGWTILAMSILTSMVLANVINQAETGGFMPYGIAATLVLLPIAIACDVFYRKNEPEKKTGAASIVMVIHAVIFALFGIGALICAVIAVIMMFTGDTDTKSKEVMLYSSLIITALYGAAFLRTINPIRLPFIRRFFVMFMTVTVGIVAVMGIVGPVATERATRDDRLIESNLNDLQTSINSYARTNDNLPNSLSELKTTGDTKLLIEKNLVRYTPNTKPAGVAIDTYNTSSFSQRKTYYYQLCVTYTKEKDSRYNSGGYSNEDKDGYVSYLSAYYHDKGEECYKLKTDSY